MSQNQVPAAKVHSQPQDGGAAQSMFHNVTRGWPTETNNKAWLPETHRRLVAVTPLQRWQAESMRDQPYHNIQAFSLKGKDGFGKPSQRQGSSVGYVDPSEHKH